MCGILEPDADLLTTNRLGRSVVELNRFIRSSDSTTSLFREALSRGDPRWTAEFGIAEVTPVVVLHGGFENPLNLMASILGAYARSEIRLEDCAVAPSALFTQLLARYTPAQRVLRFERASQSSLSTSTSFDEGVWLNLAAANTELLRKGGGPQHLSFGGGSHRCPGVAVTRLMVSLLFKALTEIRPIRIRGASVTSRGHSFVATGPAHVRLDS
jgi:hypothetical protein